MDILNRLKAVYDAECAKYKEVVGIFEDYFGEMYVDHTELDIENFCHSVLVGSPVSGFLGEDYVKRIVDVGDGNRKVITNDGAECVVTYDELFETKAEDYVIVVAKNIDNPITEIMFKVVSQYLIDHIQRNFCGVITIKFPEVTVTNEYNESIDISDLYVKVNVGYNGELIGDFLMRRATFTQAQWESHYVHSHVPGYNMLQWEQPCLGTGPIRRTQEKLRNGYSFEIWGLFCFELDKYVRVESISGGPYRRLTNVHLYNMREVNIQNLPAVNMYPLGGSSDALINHVRAFVKYLLKNNQIKMQYVDNQYMLGEDFKDFWIRISKLYADWWKCNKGENCENIKNAMVEPYIIAHRNIYHYEERREEYSEQCEEGAELFTFKGNPVCLHIDKTEDNNQIVYLIKYKIIRIIISNYLKIVSFYYDNNSTQETTSSKKYRIL